MSRRRPDPLERSYRRLIRVYPVWYRRERGLELLTTLLDDAQPGQHRPHPADVAGLIRGAIRARIVPPRRLTAWLANIMIALSIAQALSSAAVLASGYPGPPTEKEAIAVATIAIGPPTHNVPGPAVKCPCGEPTGSDQVVREDDEPMRGDGTLVYYDPPWQQATTMWARARERLVAAGWHVLPRADPNDLTYVASSAGFDVFVYAQPFNATSSGFAPTVVLTVNKRVPATAIYGAFAGVLGGLVAGWLTGVWALHRHHRHDPRRRRIIRAIARPFFPIAALILQITATFVVVDFSDGVGGSDVEAPMAYTGLGGIPTGLSLACVVLGLAAIAVTAWPSASGSATTDGSPAAHQAPA